MLNIIIIFNEYLKKNNLLLKSLFIIIKNFLINSEN